MAPRFLQLFFAVALLQLIALVTCKEINSTQDLNKEETHELELPWQYDDASSSRSKSYSASSSKSHGEGTGKGTGYGGSDKNSRGHGYGVSGKGSGSGYKVAPDHDGDQQKGKLEVYSYEKPDSAQNYGGQYQKPGQYNDGPSGGGYGHGYDDRSQSGYGSGGPRQTYSEQGYGNGPSKAVGSSYTGHRDADSNSYGGASSVEQGDIKAEYVDYYPGQNSYTNTQSHSSSSGSGTGTGTGGGSSSKRGYRKEFRKQGYQTGVAKDAGQNGQPLSVYIKQLGNAPSAHSGESSGQYGGPNGGSEGLHGQKGYLLLPVVPNGSPAGGGYKSEEGTTHQGYSGGNSAEKSHYDQGALQGPQNLYSGPQQTSFFNGKQVYDLANNGPSAYNNAPADSGYYSNEQSPHGISQTEGGSRGKYRDISPKPYKQQQQQQSYFSAPPSDDGSYKQANDYEQSAGKEYQPALNYEKSRDQGSYRDISAPAAGHDGKLYGGDRQPKEQGYGPSVFDFSSHGISSNTGAGYGGGNVNFRSPGGPGGPSKPRKGSAHGGSQVKGKNIGSQYEQRAAGNGYRSDDVEVKPINPNLYTQRQPIDVLPQVPFIPENFYSAQLNNFPVQRQIINHGPMGVSVSYKSLGNDLTGLEGLDVLNTYDGQHAPVGIGNARHSQRLVANKAFGSQIDARVRPLTDVQPQFQKNQKAKSIAIFLQKPHQYRSSGGFTPIDGGLGKLNLRGNSDIAPFDFLHGLNGMGSSLIPLSLPFGYRPIF